MTALLEVCDLKVWFGGVKAIDGVSLTVTAGKIFGIVGPNGSGKTTLINAISRVGPVSDGRIEFDGTDITTNRPFEVYRLGMARTFQGIRLVGSLSVLENVMLGADYRTSGKPTGRTPKRRSSAVQQEVRSRAEHALERVGMANRRAALPGQLSYGSQRRVEIARAIAGDPDLLLLDEPVAGMNAGERAEIADLLLMLRQDGITQILVEHDLRLVLNVTDYLYVANFGKFIAHGEPESTAAQPDVVEAYLGHRKAVL